MRVGSRLLFDRLVALDRAIRGRKYPNASSLAKDLEVSSRTIQRDIEYMVDRLNAPLKYDTTKRGYYYANLQYQLPIVNLTQDEINALTIGVPILEQIRGTPYATNLSYALEKLLAGMPGCVSTGPGAFSSVQSFRFSGSSRIAPELFVQLLNALKNQFRLNIGYRAASNGVETQRVIEPYNLSYIDGQWYLIAYCLLREEIRSFVPSRILSCVTTDQSFEVTQSFRIEEYFANSVGVMRGDGSTLHKIRIKVTGHSATYVEERTWHQSQKCARNPDGSLLVCFELGDLREIERLIMSLGAECEVLEPPELRSRLLATARKLAKTYGRTASP